MQMRLEADDHVRPETGEGPRQDGDLPTPHRRHSLQGRQIADELNEPSRQSPHHRIAPPSFPPIHITGQPQVHTPDGVVERIDRHLRPWLLERQQADFVPPPRQSVRQPRHSAFHTAQDLIELLDREHDLHGHNPLSLTNRSIDLNRHLSYDPA